MDTKGLSKFSIRTSDRRTFRRCLRKWDFQSSLRQNLTRDGSEQNINFWFGSGIHFAMEDYHGYNKFEDPRRAFYAYYNAFKDDDLPLGAEMHYELAMSMLSYYMTWMERHNKQTGFETLWIDPKTYEILPRDDPRAEPACEVEFFIPLHTYAVVDAETGKIVDSFYVDDHTFRDIPNYLPVDWTPEADPEIIYEFQGSKFKIVPIYYHGTIDRIVKDRYGRIWLWDYKTAKSADTSKLATDDQVTAYLWAAKKIFPFPVYGFVYLQMTKARATEPKRLKNGELSCDKRQHTTYGLYREALIHDYGDVSLAPSKMIDTLNHFAAQEEPEGDRFIRWDFVKRNENQLVRMEQAIYGELAVMLNPNLYCYPSPTRDCSWDCPFRDACIMMDQGDDEGMALFMKDFIQRPHAEDGNRDEWRNNIKWVDDNGFLVPMEKVLEMDLGTLPSFDETAEADGGFKFYYEEDC
jgi:hypothetical protein